MIDQRPASDETVAASFAWFPIVGFLIGVALVGEDWLLAHFFAQVIRSVLIVISLTVVTGAVHLDGLADTADALGAGRDRERALDILRDSRVGTFGASAIFFDLTLKILALSTLAGHSPLRCADFRADARAVGDAHGRRRHSLSARRQAPGSTLLSGKSSGWRRSTRHRHLIIDCAILLILGEMQSRSLSLSAVALANRVSRCDLSTGDGSAESPAI